MASAILFNFGKIRQCQAKEVGTKKYRYLTYVNYDDNLPLKSNKNKYSAAEISFIEIKDGAHLLNK